MVDTSVTVVCLNLLPCGHKEGASEFTCPQFPFLRQDHQLCSGGFLTSNDDDVNDSEHAHDANTALRLAADSEDAATFNHRLW